MGIHVQSIKQTSANGGEACPEEEVYLIEPEFGEEYSTDDDEQSCSGVDVSISKELTWVIRESTGVECLHAETMSGRTWMPLIVGLEPLTD